MTTDILNNLNQALEARTTEALAELNRLEAQIAHAIEQAEAAARERIQARLDAIARGLDDRLMGFSIRLGEMTGEALGEAVVALEQRLAGMNQPPATEQPQEAEEPQETALPSWEAIEGANPEELTREVAFVPEPMPEELMADTALPVVHAHAVVADDDLATLPEVPTTDNPEGLHQREDTGNGRGRYRPVEVPTPGETYWTRDHRRHWSQVRFTPEVGS